jgi:hypothetical protein
MTLVPKLRAASRRAWRRAADAISNSVFPPPAFPPPQPSSDQGRASILQATEGLIARWENYRAETLDQTISPHDDMFVGDIEHYFFAGRSALEVVSEAMLLARKTHFDNVLDAPCGYAGSRAISSNSFPIRRYPSARKTRRSNISVPRRSEQTNSIFRRTSAASRHASST